MNILKKFLSKYGQDNVEMTSTNVILPPAMEGDDEEIPANPLLPNIEDIENIEDLRDKFYLFQENPEKDIVTRPEGLRPKKDDFGSMSTVLAGKKVFNLLKLCDAYYKLSVK